MDWASRIRRAFAERDHLWDPDVVEELAQHAAATYEAAMSDGLDSGQAQQVVEQQIECWNREGPGLVRRIARPAAVEPPAAKASLLTGLFHDVRYAARLMLRRPGFTLLALGTMALGIGATTALFGFADAVLLRPLPWPEGDRLVRLTETREGGTDRFGPILTNATYRAWRDEPLTLSGLAAWSNDTRTLAGVGEPERLRLSEVTASLFPLLRAQALHGNLFAPDEERDPVVVLSHSLWQRRFGADPQVLGRSIQLDGTAHRVVAVMPPDFAFPDRRSRAWVPFHVRPVLGEDPDARSLSMFGAIGRLRDGSSASHAAAEGTARGRHAPELGMVGIAVFGTSGPVTVSAEPWLDALIADVRPAILVLLAAVGLLLATATANVANLQLARATTRRREISIRAALGAGSHRIAGQLLVENLLLGLCGGLGGLVLAVGLHRVLPTLLPPGFPRFEGVGINLRLLLFALAVSLVTGLVFGLVPVWQARRLDLVRSMADDGRAATGGSAASRSGRARALIMATQVAIACVLLIGAALLGRTLLALIHTDRGYDPSHTLTASLLLPDAAYSAERRAELLESMREQLRQRHGVRHVAFGNVLPLTGGESLMGLSLPAPDASSGTIQAQAAVRIVSPGYFEALGMRLVAGRGFRDDDTLAGLPVVIVNRSFARRYLGTSPLDRELPLGGDDGPGFRVAGIVDDVRQRSATDAHQPEIYLSYRQREGGYHPPQAYLVVRADAEIDALVPALRTAVFQADETLAIDTLMTMEARVMESLAQPRLYALLLSAFAVFAVTIAGVGLFGVLSYSVAQRTREIGVRSALGARPRDIVRLVVGQGLAITAVGLALGVLASFWLVRLLESLLYGVPPHDPTSFVLVLAGLLLVALLACVVPARRAARIAPQEVLRGS